MIHLSCDKYSQRLKGHLQEQDCGGCFQGRHVLQAISMSITLQWGGFGGLPGGGGRKASAPTLWCSRRLWLGVGVKVTPGGRMGAQRPGLKHTPLHTGVGFSEKDGMKSFPEVLTFHNRCLNPPEYQRCVFRAQQTQAPS